MIGFTGELEYRKFEILPETFIVVTGKERITIESLIEERIPISLGEFESMKNSQIKHDYICKAIKNYFEKLEKICECSFIPFLEDLMKEEEAYIIAETELKKLAGII